MRWAIVRQPETDQLNRAGIDGGSGPPELRDRAVRMVKEAIAEAGGERHGVVTRIAVQLGVGSESERQLSGSPTVASVGLLSRLPW